MLDVIVHVLVYTRLLLNRLVDLVLLLSSDVKESLLFW